MENAAFKNLKIAVVHDHLGWSGGGERTALIIALESGADFITAYASREKTYPHYQKQLGRRLIILTDNVVYKEVIRFFWLRFIFWRYRSLFKKYDILIASGHVATEAVVKYSKRRALKILYNHTPPRRIYDLFKESRLKYKFFLRPLFSLFVAYWRWSYERLIRRIDYNIANSENVRQRIKKYTGGEANEVVWPPILIDDFKWIEQGDYFLSWARVDEHKRVDLIAKAFAKMPDKKLIIASSGAWLEKIKYFSKPYANIKVVGWQEESALLSLVGRSRAVVYIPINEDAGMTHLEANAAGKPVLGVDEGGLSESVVKNQTGILIPANPTVKDIIQAADIMTEEWCLNRRTICEQHAKKYNKEVFVKKINNIILKNDPRRKIIGIDASRWEDPRFPGEEKRTGVEVYSSELIKNIFPLILAKGLKPRIYTPRAINALPLDLQKVIPGEHFWSLKHLNNELKYSPPDIFFTPSYFIPRSAPENSFATVHDVIFKTDPGRYSFFQRINQDLAARRNFSRAKKIITVSEFSKKQIIDAYNISPEKIKVVLLGCSNQPVLAKNEKRENLIVYVGRVEKKKSVDILIKAFLDFQRLKKDWRLEIIGQPGYGFQEIEQIAKISGQQDKILFKGYMSEAEKLSVLAKAKIFTHPSAHEGSCMPLFEAWRSAVPAVVAETDLMKEIGQGAALFFTPGDYRDLSAQLFVLAEDLKISEKLINAGEEKLKNISWEKTAEQTLAVLLEN
jgi:glycosyltransferase involved in cell wall biosynthesis